MRISTKGIYALEAITDLAIFSNEGQSISLKSIAQRRSLSEKYLERIMKSLKRAELVKSVRGAYGGYCLAQGADTITVWNVLKAVEGEMAPVDCLKTESGPNHVCGGCPTRTVWAQIWTTIQGVCHDVSILDIIENVTTN